MALGFHKINTSQSRSSRRNTDKNTVAFKVIASGEVFTYKGQLYKTTDDFVSECDNVPCKSVDTDELIDIKGATVKRGMKITN